MLERMRRLAVVLILAAAPALVAGQALPPAEGAAAAPAATVADLAWLAGEWVGEIGGSPMKERWHPPVGGAMPGSFFVVGDGKVSFYELATIEQDEGGPPVLRLRMFGRGLTVPAGREAALAFPLVKLAGTQAVFEGPDQEGPARLTYTRTGDELTVRLEKTENGQPRTTDFKFRRAGD